MKEMKIISLVGMTGCGKTSVGKKLSKKMNYDFIDIDSAIVENEKISIKNIFDQNGELYFRKIEYRYLSEIIQKYESEGNPLILSCGGGILTYKPNIDLLKSNTFVIWIKRAPLSVLKDKKILERPPVNGDVQNYINLYNARLPLYKSTCNIEVENVYPQRAALKIIKKLGRSI